MSRKVIKPKNTPRTTVPFPYCVEILEGTKPIYTLEARDKKIFKDNFNYLKFYLDKTFLWKTKCGTKEKCEPFITENLERFLTNLESEDGYIPLF